MFLKSTYANMAACAGACLLAMLLSLPSFWAYARIREAAAERYHTFEVMLHGQELLSALVDAETGERGYALTGDAAFLQPYLAVSSKVQEQLRALQQLAVAGESKRILAAITPMVDAKLAELARVIELRRSENLAEMLAVVREGTGKRLMDRIRGQLQDFDRTEQGILVQNQAALRLYLNRLRIIIMAVSVLILLAALAAVYLFHRHSVQLLKNLVHRETEHLLHLQEETNGQLSRANLTLVANETELGATLGALKEKNQELETAIGVADKANQAKSEFLSSMSHELRTPLNAILGFAQLMETAAPPPTPAQKLSIEQILQAGWYLLELINQILDLAVIESGRLSLSAEPVSLGEVLANCQSMVEAQGRTRGLELTWTAFAAPSFVHADRLRLKQVLLNLLSNAIKYNKPGGTVAVECTAINPRRIRISVRDSGPGISKGHLKQLFEPFNRLGQEHGPEEGTGIGLVMSKLLVQLMGGVMGVESTVGVGSVFWFELNRSEPPEFLGSREEPAPGPLAAVATANAPAAPRVRTVLYIEDNPANLDLVGRLLGRRADLVFLSAGDATRGFALARQQRPDVILMDINLPGLSGIRAMGMLQDDEATSGIPVLAVSANAMAGDIAAGLEAGFFRYLTKPIHIQEFMTAIDEALDLDSAKLV